VKFRVLESLKVKTPEGERELQPGEIITLPRDKAIELINQGRIAPIGRVAYKVYSEIWEPVRTLESLFTRGMR
jgi:hypothetical protein